MEITVLVENTCDNECCGTEHGLSMFIRTQKYNILFDMGQTTLFLENAKKLGVDLASVDFAVLSHGHYDHGGGLDAFLKINKKALVYVNENVFGGFYNAEDRYIGLDKSLKNHPRIVQVAESLVIEKGIMMVSCNNKKKKYDFGSFGLKKEVEACLIADDFCHEQYLCIAEHGKKVVFSGCAHRGVLNIMDWLKPDIFVGGFHISKIKDKVALDHLAHALNSYNADYYTCHCTGQEQYLYMKQHMPRLFYLSSGKKIII